MLKARTRQSDLDVLDFIKNFSDIPQKLKDSYELIHLMGKISEKEPKMWGPSTVGFGFYNFKYASGHEGDAPIIGFSPRKTGISLYVFTGLEEHKPLLEGLGKFKIGKSCLLIKKLADIDRQILTELIKATIKNRKKNISAF